MYLKYGDYSHTAGEVTLQGIIREGIGSDEGVVYAIKERWNIEGMLQITDQGTPAANQAEMTTAINALKAAYATNGKDIGFYDDSGNLTAHSIKSSATERGGASRPATQFPRRAGGRILGLPELYAGRGGPVQLHGWRRGQCTELE